MSDFRSSLEDLFSKSTPLDLSPSFQNKACVAVLLTGNGFDDLQVGYIRRSTSERDRWSGQIAFPGGRFEESDQSHLNAALREVEEEIGFSLQASDCVGRLSDLQARKSGEMLEFYIRPFLFLIDQVPQINLNPDEVSEFFWVRLSELRNPNRATTFTWSDQNQPFSLPAIRLGEDPPLWGLTLMMTQNLLHLLP